MQAAVHLRIAHIVPLPQMPLSEGVVAFARTVIERGASTSRWPGDSSPDRILSRKVWTIVCWVVSFIVV